MMEQIGDKLAVYQRYEKMFPESELFQIALANVYYDIILFLCRARTVFKQAWRKYLISGIDKNRCQNRKVSIESILESILIINLKIVVQR
jgi:hypothetical protein